MMQTFWDPIQALFYTTDIGGWIGPLMLIVLSFMVLSNRKYRPLGILFLVVETLIMWSYVDLVIATPWYWWNIVILVIGDLLCLGQMLR
jgi:hypothetical protein